MQILNATPEETLPVSIWSGLVADFLNNSRPDRAFVTEQ